MKLPGGSRAQEKERESRKRKEKEEQEHARRSEKEEVVEKKIIKVKENTKNRDKET